MKIIYLLSIIWIVTYNNNKSAIECRSNREKSSFEKLLETRASSLPVIFQKDDTLKLTYRKDSINLIFVDSLNVTTNRGLTDSTKKTYNNKNSSDTTQIIKPIKNKPLNFRRNKTKNIESFEIRGFRSERIVFEGKSYDVVRVDIRYFNIKLFYEDKILKQSLSTLYNALKVSPSTLMLMNGGMYAFDEKKHIKPVGLYVENGCEINKIDTLINRSGNFYMQPNGVFLIDKQNRPFILKTKDYHLLKNNTIFATQSGPMLVINNKINSLFNPYSINTNIRNGVGWRDFNTVVFIISNEPVNFYEFARLFRDKYRCEEALYLDGTISGAVIPSLKRDDSLFQNNYAVFIGVEPKKIGGKK